MSRIATEQIEEGENAFLETCGRLPVMVLEIGSAGGITKVLRPNWTTSDVRVSQGVDLIFPAERIGMSDESVDMIFMQDVLHHISNLKVFFDEAYRVLKPEGIIFLKEPFWGPLAQLVFRFLHPEEFNLKKVSIMNKFDDPMSGNQALAWDIIRNPTSPVKYSIDSRGFNVKTLGPRLGLAFLLSGGSTFSTKFPRSMLNRLHNLEKKIVGWYSVFGFGYLFFLHKVPTEKKDVP